MDLVRLYFKRFHTAPRHWVICVRRFGTAWWSIIQRSKRPDILTLEEEITTLFRQSDNNHTVTLRQILDSRCETASSRYYNKFALNFTAAEP